MPWFKVDDSLALHAKTVTAGNAAMGLWVRAGSWSAQQLTDGFVPDHIVSVLGTMSQARALVNAGLWDRKESGFAFREWADRNPTRAEVQRDREAARERMRQVRESRSAGVRANTNDCSPEVLEPRPDPTRPDPTTTSVVVEKAARKQRATRIPEDFTPDPSLRQWAALKAPHIDVESETEKFRDFWTAKSGQNATKNDWAAAWRYWMSNARAPNTTNLPAPRAPLRAVPSTTDTRVATALALSAKYAEEDS